MSRRQSLLFSVSRSRHRAGWLEARGWITCIDPPLTHLTQAQDFGKRRLLPGRVRQPVLADHL